MHTIGLIATLAVTPLAAAQPLDGAYLGSIGGTPATLTLRQDGTALQGSIDAGGYGYSLAGTAEGATASGTLTDPQAGSAVPFELAARGDGLTLTVLTADAYGHAQRVPFAFQRRAAGPSPAQGSVPGSSAGPAPSTAGSAPGPPDGSPREPAVERDPALVGRWGYSDTYVSGDFSAVTRLSLEINPDGTYLYGSGSLSVGGENEYGSYGGQSSGGDGTRGEWRTEGNVVYVREPDAGGWTPYARYYVEGGRMLLTFGDGSRQAWTRR